MFKIDVLGKSGKGRFPGFLFLVCDFSKPLGIHAKLSGHQVSLADRGRIVPEFSDTSIRDLFGALGATGAIDKEKKK